MGTCYLGGIRVLSTIQQNNGQMADPLAGIKYALTVPGRLLIPSSIGVPAYWCASALSPWFVWVAGILVLGSLLTLALWRKPKWEPRFVVLGAAIIYLGYALPYVARAGLVKQGRWTESQLICQFGSRYHVLPLIGMAAVLAATLSGWRLIRRCDDRSGIPALVATLFGLALMALQSREIADHWSYNLRYPDQKATMSALDHVRRIACQEGISQTQLLRIVTPAIRPWNASVLNDCPSAFPLMKLVDAPQQVTWPRTDEEARALLQARLTLQERIALGSGACASINPMRPGDDTHTVAVARRLELERACEDRPGFYRSEGVPGLVKCEFDRSTDARFLILPGLQTSQELDIFLRDGQGRWRPGQFVRWLPSPRSDKNAVIDLSTMIHLWGEPITQIAVQFTRPGEIALEGPPRLLR